MNCVFFGSPDFAVASLEALLNSEHKVVGVITQPDRPAGRGLKLEQSPVKILAQKHGLPILQPEKVNSDEVYAWLESHNPQILIVVAYGEFLGKKLLEFCKTPPVNVHPSLLPKLRGAAPMQWALLNGDIETGVTTQYMAKEMDAGDILLQAKVEVSVNENGKELSDKLKKIGGDLLVKTITQIESGTINPQKQDDSLATFAPLLKKEDGLIAWHRDSFEKIHNQIRGLFPWPAAYTYYQGKRIKILRSCYPSRTHAMAEPGSFSIYGKSLLVFCANGPLEVWELQPEGKRPMLPAEFMNGMKNSSGPLKFQAPEEK